MKVITPKFRVSYPVVFKPKPNKYTNHEEYTLTALFSKDTNLNELRNALKLVTEERWGADPKKWPKPFENPIKKQEDLAELDEEGNPKRVDGMLILPNGCEEGGHYIRFKSKQRPGLIDKNKQEILDPSDFYAGCYARAEVKVFAFDKGKQGVSIWMDNIQKLAEGDPISGRSRPEAVFEAVKDGSDTSDALSLFNCI